jgi:hypothetical protein
VLEIVWFCEPRSEENGFLHVPIFHVLMFISFEQGINLNWWNLIRIKRKGMSKWGPHRNVGILFMFEMGSLAILPKLALNLWSSSLSLPRRWDYRCARLCLLAGSLDGISLVNCLEGNSMAKVELSGWCVLIFHEQNLSGFQLWISHVWLLINSWGGLFCYWALCCSEWSLVELNGLSPPPPSVVFWPLTPYVTSKAQVLPLFMTTLKGFTNSPMTHRLAFLFSLFKCLPISQFLQQFLIHPLFEPSSFKLKIIDLRVVFSKVNWNLLCC